ncbi:uncharacterized protein LOC111698137 [Eurytemora carolleeae]|uniref:uncharacterized protein LOC111698137 n=1 Tax=Eurytemora carolleeae TaxID=1294199 RepID=UPI000C77093F|nr:uncharacterized protein LOC111698137 [Eurytemora carolleeae]|eukprot:XP_023324158.1 uncharacterized protein LOC111698137 [Eurytemora affinis]
MDSYSMIVPVVEDQNLIISAGIQSLGGRWNIGVIQLPCISQVYEVSGLSDCLGSIQATNRQSRGYVETLFSQQTQRQQPFKINFNGAEYIYHKSFGQLHPEYSANLRHQNPRGTTEPPKLITWGSVSQMRDLERKSNTREQWKSSNSRLYSKYIIPLVKGDEHEEIREIVSNLKEMEPAQEGDLEENKRRTNLSKQKVAERTLMSKGRKGNGNKKRREETKKCDCNRKERRPSTYENLRGFPSSEFPWIVGIMQNGFLMCTGHVVSQTFILTSASCILSGNTGQIPYIQHTEDNFSVKKIIIHHGWDRLTGLNDFALLEITSFINSTICIKTQQDKEADEVDEVLIGHFNANPRNSVDTVYKQSITGSSSLEEKRILANFLVGGGGLVSKVGDKYELQAQI